MATAVVLTSCLGLSQEAATSNASAGGPGYPALWREQAFYNHFLGLVLFLPFIPQLHDQLLDFIDRPHLFLYLLLNCLTQSVCLCGVYSGMQHMSAVSTQMATTVRKFVSVLASVLFFGHTWTPTHWIGTLAVVLGSW